MDNQEDNNSSARGSRGRAAARTRPSTETAAISTAATTTAAAAPGNRQLLSSGLSTAGYPQPHAALLSRVPNSTTTSQSNAPAPPPEYFGTDDLPTDVFKQQVQGNDVHQQRLFEFSGYASPALYRNGPHDGFFPNSTSFGAANAEYPWEMAASEPNGIYTVDHSTAAGFTSAAGLGGKTYGFSQHHPASTSAFPHHLTSHQHRQQQQQQQLMFHHPHHHPGTVQAAYQTAPYSAGFGGYSLDQSLQPVDYGGWEQADQYAAYGNQQQYQNAPGMSIAGNARSSSSNRTRTSSSSTRAKKQRATYSPIAGENRLKINFLSYGRPGEILQHFGTKGYIIPDGVSGTHEVYHQRWKFEIQHNRQGDEVLISWIITNLASGTITSRSETTRESRVRETSGHTICNQLLRLALKNRAIELEESLKDFADNPTKTANTHSLIKVLKPKSCILGLLFFGLLHETVQEKMREMIVASGGTVPPPPRMIVDDGRGTATSAPNDGEDETNQDNASQDNTNQDGQ